MDYLSILEGIWAVIGPAMSGLEADAQAMVKAELTTLAKAIAGYGENIIAGTPLNSAETSQWLADWRDHFVEMVLPVAKGMSEEAVEIASAKSTDIALTVLAGIIPGVTKIL